MASWMVQWRKFQQQRNELVASIFKMKNMETILWETTDEKQVNEKCVSLVEPLGPYIDLFLFLIQDLWII